LALPSTPTQATAEADASTKLLGREEVWPGNERPELTRDIFDGFTRMRDLTLQARIPTTLPVLVIQAEFDPIGENLAGSRRLVPRDRRRDSRASRRATDRVRGTSRSIGAIRDEVQCDVLEWLGHDGVRAGAHQYSRTASWKCQVRRISITSNSLASPGGNASYGL